MQLDNQFKIEKAMSKDPTRANLASGYIEENGKDCNMSRLIATNGHMLACVPFVTPDMERGNPQGFRLSSDAVKAMRKNGGHGNADLKGKKVLINGIGYPMGTSEDQPYPDYTQVIPDPNKCKHHMVSLNPKFLLDLADAIGGKRGITLHFSDDSLAPIRVTTENEPEALGVLMPMRNPK